MRPTASRTTPAQLIRRSLYSASIAQAPYLLFLLSLYFLGPPRHLLMPILLGLIVVSVAGLTIFFRANARLKRGLGNGEWTDEEVASLRAKMRWPLLNALGMTLFVTSLGFFLSRAVTGQRSHLILGFIFPGVHIPERRTNYRTDPAEPRANAQVHPHRTLWSDVRPLQPDHWGGEAGIRE